MFPFSEGVLEFQAMVAAGLTPARALKAGTSVAAELLQRDDLGVYCTRQAGRHRRHAGRSFRGYRRHGEGRLCDEGRRVYRHGAFDFLQ